LQETLPAHVVDCVSIKAQQGDGIWQQLQERRGGGPTSPALAHSVAVHTQDATWAGVMQYAAADAAALHGNEHTTVSATAPWLPICTVQQLLCCVPSCRSVLQTWCSRPSRATTGASCATAKQVKGSGSHSATRSSRGDFLRHARHDGVCTKAPGGGG
jgi:hypothetical protein